MLKLALAPLLVAQALRTRARLPRLPEPPGERSGQAGSGPPLKLLVLGDSSAAGVGVAHQHDALAAPLAAALARAAGRRVAWRLLAQSGLTTAQLLPLVRQEAPAPADVAVVVSGVNDVVDQVRPARAVAARTELLAWLRGTLSVGPVWFTPLPPMGRFAGLPQPLRWVAGRDARAHDEALARWAALQHDVHHPQVALPLEPGLLAADGFHPGAPVYHLWAQALAGHITQRLKETPP